MVRTLADKKTPSYGLRHDVHYLHSCSYRLCNSFMARKSLCSQSWEAKLKIRPSQMLRNFTVNSSAILLRKQTVIRSPVRTMPLTVQTHTKYRGRWHKTAFVILDRQDLSYFQQTHCEIGHRCSTVVKVLCYKSEGRWFDPSWCHWIFH